MEVKIERRNAKLKNVLQHIVEIAVIVSIILAIKFVVNPLIVSGESMEPTLHGGDIIIVSRSVDNIERGDIVVCGIKEGIFTKKVVKRIIGLPGDTVSCRNGHIYINDEWFDDYTHSAILKPGVLEEPVEVQDGEYFILGDNRNHSEDSRVYGCVKKEQILGKMTKVFSLKNND